MEFLLSLQVGIEVATLQGYYYFQTITILGVTSLNFPLITFEN